MLQKCMCTGSGVQPEEGVSSCTDKVTVMHASDSSVASSSSACDH